MEAVSERGRLPEVNDLDDLGTQGEVVGFDIPVHISMTVNVCQPARHLLAHFAKVESSVTPPLHTKRMWQARPQNTTANRSYCSN